jgi:hypothetical protein
MDLTVKTVRCLVLKDKSINAKDYSVM